MATTATFVQGGDSIDYTPGSGVDAGDVVVLGTNRCGIAKRAIAANELGALCIRGVFTVPKDTTSTSALAMGATVYWDSGNEWVEASSGGNTFFGYVVEAADASDSTVKVLLTW